MKGKLNIFSFCAVWMLAATLAGCTKDTTGTDAPVIGPDGTYKGQITVELPTANAAVIQTREAGDATVTDAWILQFDMSITEGKLVRAEYTTETSVGGKRLFVEAHFVPGDKMKLVLVVNTHDAERFNETNLPVGSGLTAIDNNTFTITASKGTGVPHDDKGLLMTGRTEELTLGATTDPVLMTLKHTVAKIAVSCDLSQFPAGVSFSNLKMRLKRVPTVMSIPAPITAPYPTTEAANFKDYEAVALPDGTAAQAVWYMGPNLRGNGSATEPSEKTGKTAPAGQEPYCTYVELSGIYQVSATSTPTEVVYRLWLGENNMDDYNIAAGKLYDIKIIPVNASHFDSRITTYANGLDLSDIGSDGNHNGMTPWGKVTDYTTQPANCYIASAANRTIVFDATKKPRSVVTGKVAHSGYLSGTESGTGNYYTGGVYPASGVPARLQNAQLATDLLPGEIDRIEVVWQTAVEHGVGFNGSPNDGQTTVSDYRTLTLDNNSPVKAFINTIAYDKATGYAAVVTNGTGNALIAAYSAENSILWSWHIWGTDTEPQASIDPGNTANGTGKMFMDRNLGALSATAIQPTEADAYKYFGLLYQWGRKEPFTGAGPQYTTTLGSDVNSIPTAIFNQAGVWIQTSTETSNTLPITNTLGGYIYQPSAAASTYTLLINPTTHYCASDNGIITSNPNTWVPYSSNIPKSIYDPCPYGYRVPIIESWSGLSATAWTQYAVTAGVSWKSSWWPASGARSYNKANLYVIGHGSYYWFSSKYPTTTQAYTMNFLFDGKVYNDSANRSYGFSVRCIQE